MDMRQIRHLLAVAEHGNILRAAAAIHISQPALSRSIQNLEHELGVKLLERGPRGVAPTVYGTALLKHARLLGMRKSNGAMSWFGSMTPPATPIV